MAAFNSLFVALTLFGAMLGALELGRRIRLRELDAGGQTAGVGAAVEGAVFALLGLLIAFTFTGAAGRFDDRRHLIVEEANAIGTAWLRVDVLSQIDQPPLRDAFRRYTDGRLAVYRAIPDLDAVAAGLKDVAAIQDQLWKLSVAAVNRDGRPQAATLLLPALNEMFDIASARTATARMHIPGLILGLLCGLAVLASMLAGYAMASPRSRSWVHMITFAAVIAVTVYVILDFEFPRLGFLRVDAMDQLLIDTRAAMD